MVGAQNTAWHCSEITILFKPRMGIGAVVAHDKSKGKVVLDDKRLPSCFPAQLSRGVLSTTAVSDLPSRLTRSSIALRDANDRIDRASSADVGHFPSVAIAGDCDT